MSPHDTDGDDGDTEPFCHPKAPFLEWSQMVSIDEPPLGKNDEAFPSLDLFLRHPEASGGEAAVFPHDPDIAHQREGKTQDRGSEELLLGDHSELDRQGAHHDGDVHKTLVVGKEDKGPPPP